MTRHTSLLAPLLGVSLATALLMTATPARGAGFLVYDVSASALGKGSATVAGVNDPSAVFFNPAALAYMRGYQVSAGTVWVTAGSRFEPQGGGATVDAEQLHFFLPTIYGSARVTRWLSVGLGVYTIFGLGVEWPEDWIGRESAIRASVQTVTFSPTLSFRLHDRVSLAAGLNVVRGVVDMTNGLTEAIGGTVRIGGAAFGFGAHAALLVRILPERLHFAAVYHSRAKLSFDNGRADFEPAHEEFEPDLQDQGGKSAITLPDILSFGVLYRPIPKLSLSFDTNVVFWSTYDKLVLDFEKREPQVLLRNNKNVATFRLGFEYAFPKGFTGRLGFIYDMNPAPKEYLSPSLPDANRVDVALGVGYEWKWLKVDVGYMLVYFLPSESVGGAEGPEGTYKTIAHLTALTLTARFGMGRKTVPPAAEPEPVAPELRPAAAPADNALRPATAPADNARRPATAPADNARRPAAAPADNARRPAAAPADNARQPATP